ncbi:acyl carrier protein [Stappia sp.]|uniref:acyl carrier protein n=1 Tax=Stappia sp. TaxID=1870903 RepID=UPI0032D99BF3
MDAQTLDTTGIKQTLNAYLLENSGVTVSGGIDPDENLLDSGILDSLGIAEITEFIEKEFGFDIDEDEITAQNYRSLNTLVAFCADKLAAKAG